MGILTQTDAAGSADPEPPGQPCSRDHRRATPGEVDEVRPADEVISSYHDLWRVEQSFRMSKSDLAAQPISHHTREAIEAHLTIMCTALAVAGNMHDRTGLSLKQIITTLRPHRSYRDQRKDRENPRPHPRHRHKAHHPHQRRTGTLNECTNSGRSHPKAREIADALLPDRFTGH